MSIIKVEDLTKTYGSITAIDHISFCVEQGSLLGFLGVNGAGKSTAINMLSTLLRPDSGTVTICGHILGKEDEAIRKKIGIVYQQNCLDELLTVRENLICRGILHGASRAQVRQQLDKISKILKLEDILNRKYKVLSGGQKRRCEIAAALMHTPEILFLDEPTTGLDPATRKDVWETVLSLRENENMTVFLTTHYMEEAAKSDHIIILDRGRIVDSGTPFVLKELYARDKLRLYCDAAHTSRVHSLLSHCEVQPIPFGLEVLLCSTMDAPDLIQIVREYIDGFEVIQGNMDDVFLSAVGQQTKQGRDSQ